MNTTDKRAPLLVIGAGGTGGHMFPAQALAEEMLARGWRVTLTTDERGARYSGRFPDAVTQEVMQSASFAQGGKLSKLKVPFKIVSGILSAIRAMRADRPALVAGFGGYPAIPAMFAARFLKVPTIIHEQNGVLGRVNRFFAPKVAKVVCGTWPTPMPEGADALYVGNPVRPDILALTDVAYPVPEGTTSLHILVIGGSQGAQVLSDVVPSALAALEEGLRTRLVVTHQARPEDEARVKATYSDAGIEATVSPFFNDIPERMSKAALVISRSGASSVAEITAMGRPSILIPYLFAMDDHQTANAQALETGGAAVVMGQKGLTFDMLKGQISEILSNPDKAAEMASAAKALGRPNAARELADLIETLAKKD